jgi:hypothetical protein
MESSQWLLCTTQHATRQNHRVSRFSEHVNSSSALRRALRNSLMWTLLRFFKRLARRGASMAVFSAFIPATMVSRQCSCPPVGTPAEISAAVLARDQSRLPRNPFSSGLPYWGFGIPRAPPFSSCSHAGESMPTDTILTFRCPYCMAGIDFRPMIAYKDGRFVCRDCAHTVRPGLAVYKCTCRRCLRLSRATTTGRSCDLSVQ